MKPWLPVVDGNESTTPRRVDLHGVRPASEARLRAWVEGLVTAGLARPAQGGRFELVCSQADLARRLGLSPSSGGISKRFTSLERIGVLVCRDPVLFDLGLTPWQAATSRSEPAHTRTTCAEITLSKPENAYPESNAAAASAEVDRLGILVDLLREVCSAGRVDLLDRVLEVVSSTLNVPATARSAARRTTPTISRAEPAPSVPSPSRSRSSSLLPSSLLSSSLLSSSPLPFPLLPHATASPSALVIPDVASPVTPRDDAGRRERYRFRPTPDAAARLQALAPLLEECARRGLPGVGSPKGLLEAFDGYTLEQITRGVEFVRRQLAASSPLRSPVGLLAHMARTGDLALVEDIPIPSACPATLRGLADVQVPSQEPAGEWLARMGALMSSDEAGA